MQSRLEKKKKEEEQDRISYGLSFVKRILKFFRESNGIKKKKYEN